MRFLYCPFIRKAFPEMREIECCSSCHHDDEEGYVRLSQVELSKQRIIEYCCAMSPRVCLKGRKIEFN